MTRQTWARPVVAALAAVTVGLALAPATSTAAVERETTPTATTTVTFLAPDCDGCRLELVNAGPDHLWSSKERTVRDGQVSFEVPTARTNGMSVAIRTPWEGGTGYVTQVAFKYSGKQTGDQVSFGEARVARKASACWAGTTSDEATIRLATRRVTVAGHDGPRTRAALVYTPVTQDARVPMLRTFHGILGSQDVIFCGPH